MKSILFILAILLFSCAVFAKTYQYNAIAINNTGNNDNFSFSESKIAENKGIIKLYNDCLYIDGQKLELKKRKSNNCYKSNNCLVKLKYTNGDLNTVEVIKFDKRVVYNVLPENKIF